MGPNVVAAVRASHAVESSKLLGEVRLAIDDVCGDALRRDCGQRTLAMSAGRGLAWWRATAAALLAFACVATGAAVFKAVTGARRVRMLGPSEAIYKLFTAGEHGDASDGRQSKAGETTDGLREPDPRYTFISTTQPPRERDLSLVACPAGRSFQYPEFLKHEVPRIDWHSSLPPAETWDAVWEISTASRADPCDTPNRAAVRLPSKHHGFGSAMNNFVNEVLISMYSAIPVVLCSPKGTLADPWAESFVNPGLHHCDACDPVPDDLSVVPQVWCVGAESSMKLAKTHPQLLIGIKRFIYKKLFQFSDSVEAAATEMEKSLGLFNESYVGVHYRRGDKLKEVGAFRDVDAFVEHATRLCDAIGAKKVFLASDDPSARFDFQGRLRHDLEVVAQPALDPKQYAERKSLDDAAKACLYTDLILLKRSTGYVGTASSNLDRWVWFQRDPALQSVSLDDGGDWLYRSC